MTSRLRKQDDEFLHLTRYLHDEDDEYSEWMCSEKGECPDPDIPQFILEADASAAYELRMDYRIRKSDGKVFIDSIK